jgi:hypothetical protein
MADLGNYAGRDKPPLQYVYLVTAAGEWPITAIADGPHAAYQVEERARQRGKNHAVRVWRATISDITEIELIPARTVQAELRAKGDSDGG